MSRAKIRECLDRMFKTCRLTMIRQRMLDNPVCDLSGQTITKPSIHHEPELSDLIDDFLLCNGLSAKTVFHRSSGRTAMVVGYRDSWREYHLKHSNLLLTDVKAHNCYHMLQARGYTKVEAAIFLPPYLNGNRQQRCWKKIAFKKRGGMFCRK